MKYISGLAVSLFPVVALAASGIEGVIDKIKSIIDALIPLVIGIAVIVFIWGILQYIIATDDDKRKEARYVMIYGIIVLFVMVSVWGLVELLSDTLDIDAGGTSGINVPGIPN
ncbi:MAG TPA: hypothetical protein P5328_01130 [Candidatus Paceibacterota bacterium]|nr:hypothetical protein [Candidatus Paceibacterota bacterium]HRZ34589.1 hypothetical protein [Candidatus Paceibacterota bacterium]